MSYVKGLDISIVRGQLDFNALKAEGYEFIICRCGVGNDPSDTLYASNMQKGAAAGLKMAAYHFVYPLPSDPSKPSHDAKVQAAMHYKAAGDVLPFLDLEWPVVQNWAKWGCTAPQIVQWTIDYLQEYERISGVRPVVYTYPSFADAIKLPASFGQDYKLWIASYTSTPRIPAPWTDWIMWQTTGGTLVQGRQIDTDVAKDLSLWDNVSGSSQASASRLNSEASSPSDTTPPDPAMTDAIDTTFNGN